MDTRWTHAAKLGLNTVAVWWRGHPLVVIERALKMLGCDIRAMDLEPGGISEVVVWTQAEAHAIKRVMAKYGATVRLLAQPYPQKGYVSPASRPARAIGIKPRPKRPPPQALGQDIAMALHEDLTLIFRPPRAHQRATAFVTTLRATKIGKQANTFIKPGEFARGTNQYLLERGESAEIKPWAAGGQLLILRALTQEQIVQVRRLYQQYVMHAPHDSEAARQDIEPGAAESRATEEHFGRGRPGSISQAQREVNAQARKERKALKRQGKRPDPGWWYGDSLCFSSRWALVPGSSRHIGSIPVEYDDGTTDYQHVGVDTVDVSYLCNDGSEDVCRITRSRHGLGWTWPDGRKESSKKDWQFWPWLAQKVGADVAAQARAAIQERDHKRVGLHPMYIKRKKKPRGMGFSSGFGMYRY